MQSSELFLLLFISRLHLHNTVVAIEILSNMNIETKSFDGPRVGDHCYRLWMTLIIRNYFLFVDVVGVH